MDCLQEECNNIDQDLCIKLIESVPERIKKCLKAKGGLILKIMMHSRLFLNKMNICKSALSF